jgi:hypothetical protein
MKNTIGILSCVILLSFLATPVFSEDFTFNVPVQITGLHPDITKGRVGCSIKKFQSGSGSDPIWREGSQEFNIVNGQFNNTLTIKFDMWPGKDPAEARFWRCDMDLYSTTLGWRMAGFQFDTYTAGGPYKWDNVNSKVSDSGQIPTGSGSTK